MPVAGLRGTGDWGTDERPKNFRESILWMYPDGDTPLLGLSSMAMGKKMVTDDPEFSWWCEPAELIRLQVNKAGDYGTTETLIEVDSGDPTATSFKSNYGKATHLVPGDVLMVEPTTDTASDTAERLVVTQVHSDTQFSVQRGALGTTAAAIVDNAMLLHIGSAFAEGTAEPVATSRNPIKFTNKTQIFKTTYELTGTAANTRLRTGDSLSNDKKRRSYDHAKAVELALLFGQQSESLGPNGKPIRTMDGLRAFIPSANTTILANNWGLTSGAGGNLLDAISPVFDYSSPSGTTRIGLCGNGALNAINKAIAKGTGVSMRIQWGGNTRLWGMNFRELIFPQGRILLKTHPLMSRHALYTNSMWSLDMSSIKYVPMKGRDTKSINDIQNKGEDVRRGMWQTECSLQVDFAGQTNGYIGGFNATLA